MNQRLAHVTLVVQDYDEAIAFYTQILGFRLLEDTPLSDTKRWVLVSPGEGSCNLLLAKAATDEQRSAVGRQTGGRVAFFLYTDDFATYYARLRGHGVTFVRGPVEEAYGTVAVFKDFYGNLWDLIEPKEAYKDTR